MAIPPSFCARPCGVQKELPHQRPGACSSLLCDSESLVVGARSPLLARATRYAALNTNNRLPLLRLFFFVSPFCSWDLQNGRFPLKPLQQVSQIKSVPSKKTHLPGFLRGEPSATMPCEACTSNVLESFMALCATSPALRIQTELANNVGKNQVQSFSL